MLRQLSSDLDYVFEILEHDILAGDLKMKPSEPATTYTEFKSKSCENYRISQFREDEQRYFMVVKALNIGKQEFQLGFKLQVEG